MESNADEANVIHNTRDSRFEVQVDGHVAVLEYQMRDNRMVVTHTGVPQPIEGRGIASKLARAALDYARENSYKVVPACEFMEVYLRRHPEYKTQP
jgi:predicted GNAT family acetyltransferase